MKGGGSLAVSEAKKRANNKYGAKTYTHVTLNLKNAFAAEIKLHNQLCGESANSFFIRAAVTQMAIDKEGTDNK